MAATIPDKKQTRRPDLESLYCVNPDGSRNKIQTADVRGRYQVRKKLVWAVLFAIYLALPWLEIGGRPAVLFDITRRHFYLFGQTFNAQDFYFAFFALTGVGFLLFVVSALFGRVWCGYACPHTVFLEGVFRRWERWVEGNAQQQKRLSESGWTARKIVKRITKWAGYLAVSLFLSHTFLSYFMPVDDVFRAVVSPPSEHPIAFGFVVAFTAIIYFNFAWFREQLCIVVCPYGRLQGVLYDPDTINVGYDQTRGEPRGRYNVRDRSDCIDCYRCVAVCPTGIDIRNGTQLECVGCANCIDACDEVMTKLDQPKGLVRYDSQNGFEGRPRRLLRPRFFLYAVLLGIGATAFAVAALRREPFEANVLRQQGAAYTILEDGRVQNAFLLHLYNKQPTTLDYVVEVVGKEGVDFVLPIDRIRLAPLHDARLPVFVRFDRRSTGPRTTIELVVRAGELERVATATLLGPRP